MNTPIHDFLCRYADKDGVRCHMPGSRHPHDITEIMGADSLYECDGIIRESEQNAASLFHSGATAFSCSGSTLAIQAMLAVAAEKKGHNCKIAAGRYSHRSFVNTAILLGFEIIWLYPHQYLSAKIPLTEIERGISEGADAVFVNSIDYYGGESDVAAIATLCHRHGVLLLVDNAHGAYKVFGNKGDTHPIALGADMVADSAHKTLPALTGAAYLHLRDSADYPLAKAAMSLFGTSSPSYLILDSLDLCNRHIADEKAAALASLALIHSLKAELKGHGYQLCKSDAIRITVDARHYGYTGNELAAELRSRSVECEMSDRGYIILLFSTVFSETEADRLKAALLAIPRRAALPPETHVLLHPEQVMTARTASQSRKAVVLLDQAVGEICGKVVSPCPPGVPLVMPGERIDEGCIAALSALGIEHISVVKDCTRES